MKFNPTTMILVLIWSLFMGVTAISIGFGALFPSMNLISKPFVCPRGEMSVEKHVYNPYPGSTITTLTWYCTDSQSGEKVEIDLFSISMSAGLIYGFLLFVVIVIGMMILTKQSAAGVFNLNDGKRSGTKLAEQRSKSVSSKEFDEPHPWAGDAKSRMQQLNDLRAANMITESEYLEKRAQILKDL